MTQRIITRDASGYLDTSRLREGAEVTIKATLVRLSCATALIQGPRESYNISSKDIHSYTVADEPIKVGDKVQYKRTPQAGIFKVETRLGDRVALSYGPCLQAQTCDVSELERVP